MICIKDAMSLVNESSKELLLQKIEILTKSMEILYLSHCLPQVEFNYKSNSFNDIKYCWENKEAEKLFHDTKSLIDYCYEVIQKDEYA